MAEIGTISTPDNDQFKGCLTFAATLLFVGAVGEILYHISPKAGYGFILLVIMGYAATGKNLEHVTDFFKSVNGKTK